jgi:beta-glucosidase
MTSSNVEQRTELLRRAAGLRFPPGFRFGTATAAYQIEGSPKAEGKGESIWDGFVRKPGAIIDGSTGDIACDHYNLLRDDIRLMKELGVNAYRFSLAWTRIQPRGEGPANAAGLDFYRILVDGLLAENITPYVTLYHWDLPQALQDKGGWYSRDTSYRLADYADIATRALGDRVKNWTTLNEPWTFCWSGHATGEDAPGFADGVKGGICATHHALLGHGLSVPIIRTNVPEVNTSIVLDLNVVEPATSIADDVAAARRFDGAQNRWYLDAVFKGRYPEDMVSLYGPLMPKMDAGDGAIIAAPIDSLGINLYRRSVIAAGPELAPLDYKRASPPGVYSAVGYEIYPKCVYDILHYVNRNYAPREVFISENGLALANEVVTPDGHIWDDTRAHYYVDHLTELSRAAREGVPVTAYFAWTLMDNFEWAYGYTAPFGIVHVDFNTQKRRIKFSGEVYREMALAQNIQAMDDKNVTKN